MSEERMKILQMLADGKITADDAAKLLDAIAEPRRPAAPGGAFAEDIKRTVEGVLQAIPKESIDDVRDVVREVVREGRDVAHEWRRWAHRGWGGRWGGKFSISFGEGHVATAPFEDVRATSANRLVLRNTRGDVRLSQSADGQLRVRAQRRVRAPDPRDAERLAERLPIEIREEGDAVVVEGPGARPFHERIRVDFDIEVPERMATDLHLIRGDVHVATLAQALAVSVVRGDVHVDNCGSIAAQLTSGDITVRHAGGDVAVQTTRGDVAVAGASGDAAISTRRGDISLRSDLAGHIAISAMRGDVALRVGRFAAGGTAAIKTLHGDVVVAVPPSASCRFDASTLSGNVRTSLPLREVVADRRRLSGVLNAPDVAVAVSTTHGDIALQALEPETAVKP
jgi:hypothetical protein